MPPASTGEFGHRPRPALLIDVVSTAHAVLRALTDCLVFPTGIILVTTKFIF